MVTKSQHILTKDGLSRLSLKERYCVVMLIKGLKTVAEGFPNREISDIASQPLECRFLSTIVCGLLKEFDLSSLLGTFTFEINHPQTLAAKCSVGRSFPPSIRYLILMRCAQVSTKLNPAPCPDPKFNHGGM